MMIRPDLQINKNTTKLYGTSKTIGSIVRGFKIGAGGNDILKT
jgi:hypothetical protein